MDGLPRLQNDIWTKILFVVLCVLAFLSLAAIFAQPAGADLIDAAGAVVDQAANVIETTTTTTTDNGVPGGEADATAPLDEIADEVIPPVVEEVVAVAEDVPTVAEDAFEMNTPPPGPDDIPSVVDDVASVAEDLIAVVDDVAPVADDSLVAADDVLAIVEVVEVLPVVADVVTVVPSQVVDVVRVLPLFVPDAVASLGPIEVPTDPVIPATSNTRGAPIASDPTKDKSHQSSGLFTKELVAEMALFHLADLTEGSTPSRSNSSLDSDRETPALAAYVPISGTMPAVGGAGGSASSGSSHSGSSFFGGVDVFGLFAALAALLALCLVGWVRDQSRSGRSIFPSHEGRPG